MQKLKACPFCGGEASYDVDLRYSDCHVVECGNCGASRRSEYGEDCVIEDWNRRYDGEGREIRDLRVSQYRAVVSARVNTRDVPVFIWDQLIDSEEDALEMASNLAKNGFLYGSAEKVTEV